MTRRLLLVGILFSRTGGAQSAFDVASVKPSAPDQFNRFAIRTTPGGRAQLLGVPLRIILMEAYDLRAFQIVGGPDWIRNDRWDIEARADGTVGVLPRVTRNAMLQSLLVDRFQLKTHQESRRSQIYTLEASKGGSKLTEHLGTEQEFRPYPGGIRVKKGGTAALAAYLSRQLGREVIDKTNLKGEYDYALEWTPELGQGGPESIGQSPATLLGAPPAPGDGPSIFTALQNQLGLRLIARKGAVRFLVVDRAEKPSPN